MNNITNQTSRKNSGFTLVELAIVIVIIGLMVGGILVGRDMIRASELRSVIKEQNKFKTAIRVFQDKYGGLPGDHIDTLELFPTVDAWCISDAMSDEIFGNGLITAGREGAIAWQVLALSGLIEGQYLGGCNTAYPWVTAPGSAISNGTWGLATNAETINNTLIFGAPHSSIPSYAILSSADTSNIDRKMDDGRPLSGSMRARNGGYASEVCVTGSTYDLSTDSVNCSMSFDY